MRSHFAGTCAVLTVLFTILLTGSVAPTMGQVVTAAPFLGNHSETWETFPNFLDGGFHLLPDMSTILGGEGTISNPQMTVYQPILADANLAGSGFAQTSDGVKGVQIGTLDPTATLTFNFPITRFGAYWGAETFGVPSTIQVDFYDASNTLFDTKLFDYNHDPAGDGGLDWHGWNSMIPIAKLTFTGDLVVLDGLQVQAVPEPSSMAVIAASMVMAGHGSAASKVGRNKPWAAKC